MKRIVCSLVGFVAVAFTTHAVQLLNDTFTYPNGPLVFVAPGLWVTHSGTTGQVDVAAGRVNLTQFESEDVNRTIPGGPYNSGNLYVCFVINFSGAPLTNGNYFAHFKDPGTSNFRAKVFALTNGVTAGRYRVGIANAANTPSAVVPLDLNFNQDYVLLVRYTNGPTPGSTLWVNPTSELNLANSATATDATTVIGTTAFAWRQSLASIGGLTGTHGMGTLQVDNLIVATSFADCQGLAAPTEKFFGSNTLPPPDGVYISPQLYHQLYAGGIIISNISHRRFLQTTPPPPPGAPPETHTFGSEVQVMLSTDNGATFTPRSAPAQVSVRLDPGAFAVGDPVQVINTEMLQLDIAGGGLPPGVMIRESPSKQSLGKTTVRTVPGGFMIGSFFDIFTEISMDGGANWTPASGAAHVDLRPDPAVMPSIPAPSRLLPPPNDLYVSPALYHILLQNGIVIKDIKHRFFTQSLPPPTPVNPTQVHHFDSQVDMQVSQDGGASFSFMRAPAAVDVAVTLRSSIGGTDVFDTEMLSLSIMGGDLPPGVMLRESPTRRSEGGTAIEPATPEGSQRIHSFFDIFTEASLDGGATWTPAPESARVNLVCNAPEVVKPSPNLPPPDGQYISPQQFHVLYQAGIIIKDVKHDRFTQSQPPPPPGGTQVHTFDSQISGQMSSDGGNTYQPISAPAHVTVRVTSTMDAGNTRYFETEMLSLNIGGGTLPGGVMIRESPSKASLGRTSIRQVGNQPPIWDYISSFFDIFTEISLDGGATWSPQTSEPSDMALAPPACAISITCPPSITVNATSAAGAVVGYPPPTVVATCPPVTVVCNPPTGSTFPIGVTPVVCMATDSAGNKAACTFKVNVRRPKPGFFPGPILPPPNGVYITPQLFHQLYANGIIIRDIRHRQFTGGQPPPPPGQTQIHQFGSMVELEHSMDGGVTFQKASAPALCSVSVTAPAALVAASPVVYDTEMLTLNVSGGTLPAGVMIRESPTLASTGKTSVRQEAGGYLIDSFFDIFTEISLDGGASWSPAMEAAEVELRPDIAGVTPIPAPTRLLPPRNDAYISPALFHILTAQGIIIKDVRHSLFTQSTLPPGPGLSQVHTFDSQLDMMVSRDNGATFQAVRAAAPVQVQVEAVGSPDSGLFDTEMLSLSASIPIGPVTVMLRESPSLPSRGQTQIDPQADGTYRIGSFFDIFTEISLDNGATWTPAQNAAHVELICDAPEQVEPEPNLPPLNGEYITPEKYHQLYANGIIISNISHKRFLQNQPPPPPGGTQVHTFGSQVEFDLIRPGLPTAHLTAPGNVQVQVRSAQDQDTTRYFDTEMLSLSIQGGGLPGGVMIRESPSKASLGRTSIRMVGAQPPIWDYISSFFDVFTEISLDGGLSWIPAVSYPGHVVLRNPATPTNCATINCPSNIVTWTCSPNGAVVDYTVSASNTCGGTVTVTCTRPSGSVFPIGTNVVTCTAVAFTPAGTPSGTNSCSFTVTVILDTLAPVIKCPTNISVWTCSPNGTSANYSATATDDCDPNPIVTCNPPSGANLPPGTNTVVCTARDACNHTSTCSFKVVVTVDTQPPRLFCPTNIVVRTCGTSEFVTYTVTVTDDCDPSPTLVCNPPSGSPFPVGTNIVTCSASDSCGHKSNCSFPVIVIQEPLPKLVVTKLPNGSLQICWRTPCPPGDFTIWCTRLLNEPIMWEQVTNAPVCDAAGNCCVTLPNVGAQRFYRLRRNTLLPTFSTTDTLPPAGVFSSPRGDVIRFPNGVLARWFIHRVLPPPPIPVPPPCLGCPQQVITFPTVISFQHSTDNGRTFQDASAPVTVSVAVQAAVHPEPKRFFDTEMLSMTISGGTLPAGVMIRESPTRASLGKHCIADVEGGFMVSSFFDVFLDISTDGGQNWLPAPWPVHVDYSSVAPEQFRATESFPPTGQYSSPPGAPTRYANGILTRWIVHRVPPLPCPPVCPPPPPCLTCPPEIYAFPGTLDLQWSIDGGQTFNQASLQSATRVRVLHAMDTADTRIFETELLSLDLSGGPAGVMLRESPSLPSKGRTALRQIEGAYMIDSFFDIFTEISVDGGASWSPVVNPSHLEFQNTPAPTPEPNDNFPPQGSYNSISNTPTRFSNGLVARRFSHQIIPPVPPRPPPCLQCPPETYDFQTILSWQISPDGGATFQNGSAPVLTSVRARHSMVASDEAIFDTEILSMQLQGVIPGGVMIRESPSRPSLGKTIIGNPQGPHPHPWSSFFDVFIELSTDGGNTWSGHSNPVHVELNPQPLPPTP